VVERGDLGDHPADADARQVRRPVVELPGERRSVGGEIAQRVGRSLGIDGGRRAAVAQVVARDVPSAARATAARICDRTPGTDPAVQMANQMGVVFSKLNCKPRWRRRLPELAIPALVVHGRRDPFFPVGNGEALAREIPGARLLVLEQAATAIPDAAAGEVAAAMLAL
jgi:pimeloyl-ACP methyl ester carboxylesterase